MAEKKVPARRDRPTAPKASAGLSSKRLEELLDEGLRLRRIVHERFENAHSVGEDAMRFLVG